MTSEAPSAPTCPWCSATSIKKDGRDSPLSQRFRCLCCHQTFTDRTGTPFARHRWPLEVITTAVRWYLRYRLSAANVRDLLAERNLDVTSRTVINWVQKFGPLLAEEARRRARPVTSRWWLDETYLRVGGRWGYLYRAVDGRGQVIDVLLREHRDLESARAFFTQAMARREARPRTVVTDKHAGYPKAVAEDAGARHVRTGLHRARGETTQPIERSHALVKDRVRPMRGLQSVRTGQRVLEGIEVARAIRRGDVRIGRSPRRRASDHERARLVVEIFVHLARGLRTAT